MRSALALVGIAGLLAGCGGGARANPAPTPTGPPAGVEPDLSVPAADRLKEVIAESQYHADLAGVHLGHGKIDAAIASYKQAVAVGKGINENALHIWHLGRAYKAKGDNANWRASLEYSAKLYAGFVADPDPARTRLKDHYCEQLANIYGELGEPTKGVEWVDQIATEGEPTFSLLRGKAQLYVKFGRVAKALEVIQQAEAQAQPGIEKDRASYTLADLLVGMRKYDEAIARLKQLADGAAEPGLRKDAKRLLFRVYDATGKLDDVDLGKRG